MTWEHTLKTERECFVNITDKVRAAVVQSGVEDGICVVYCPHTTAGITINENADPDVVRDLLLTLQKAFPDRPEYRHMEGNSTAHMKASVIGSSATLLIEKGCVLLGTWQGVYFCEFDGPRSRKYYIKIVKNTVDA